ncbi:EcsC family protein [Nocardioidaceae bacterium]|nr:EcsC family protein [Nocardioidaceae bacterium]
MGRIRNFAKGKVVDAARDRAAEGASEHAPGMSAKVVHQALERALHGVGPLPAATKAADEQLRDHDGDVEKAIDAWTRNHIALAGAQGLLTNLGGLVTSLASIPANLVGITVVQSRMVAGIAHLRGYDVEDPRVRDAVLATLLGEDRVRQLVRRRRVPAPPMALATAPEHDSTLAPVIAAEVASELVTRVAGRRLATQVGRRVPVLGGAVAAGTDAWSTRGLATYASRELRKRPAAR